MAKRTFEIGLNELNGYTINVIRFVGAYQNGENSRIAAHYWGDITHPNGDITLMGDNGMTVTEIKKIVGGSVNHYNRGGESSEIKKLEEVKSKLESLGLSTTEVDAKIQALKDERDALRCLAIEAEANRTQIKAYEKEIKKLEKVKSQISVLGLSTLEIDEKISNFQAEIAALM